MCASIFPDCYARATGIPRGPAFNPEARAFERRPMISISPSSRGELDTSPVSQARCPTMGTWQPPWAKK
eukprot:9336126-Pyramimonas_sp.AAC.1